MEQVCSALNLLSLEWQERQRGTTRRQHRRAAIAYHQQRNRAARESRQKRRRRRCRKSSSKSDKHQRSSNRPPSRCTARRGPTTGVGRRVSSVCIQRAMQRSLPDGHEKRKGPPPPGRRSGPPSKSRAMRHYPEAIRVPGDDATPSLAGGYRQPHHSAAAGIVSRPNTASRRRTHPARPA